MKAAAILLTAALSLAACHSEDAAPAENEASAEGANAASAPDDKGPTTSNGVPAVEDAEAPVPAGPTAPPAGPVPAADAAWSKSGYRLVGTEPFWGGTVTGTRILYQTPEDQAGSTIAATASYGPGGEVYTGKLGGKPFVLTLTKGPCSDGMSDKVHAYTAALQVDGGVRQGCADPQ
jgi:uncharacterized membrane protein